MPLDFASFVIPVWYLLVAYGLFLAVFTLYTAFNLYHLLRFGKQGPGLYAILALFLGGTVVLVGLSVFLLSSYDWSATINPSGLLDSTSKKQFFL